MIPAPSEAEQAGAPVETTKSARRAEARRPDLVVLTGAPARLRDDRIWSF